MKIWLYGWVFSLSLWCTGAMGQQKPNYKVAEQFLPSVAGKFIYSKDIKANYVPNSDCFWFSHKTSQGTAYYWVDPRKKEQRPLFDNAAWRSKSMPSRIKSAMQKTLISPRTSEKTRDTSPSLSTTSNSVTT